MEKTNWDEVHKGLLMIALGAFLLILVGMLGGCTDEDKSRQTLENYGFTNISVGGYDAFECGDDYTYSTHFQATNSQGRRVEGTVCCGILKGCTVKF